MSRLLSVAVLMVIAWVSAPASAAATAYLWQGPNGGDWTVPANWNPSTGFPHNADDVALIQATASSQVIAIPASAGTVKLRQLALIGAGQPITILGVSAILELNPGTSPAIVSDTANHVIQVPVVLANNCVVDVPSGSLTFILPISQSGVARTFTKNGAGAVVFTSSVSYSGPTTIQQGTLRPTTAGIIPNTMKVDVRSGATFDVPQNETIGNLTIAQGFVDLGPNVTLSVSSLDMSGGTVRTTSGSGTLALGGDVTATSSGAEEAFITAGVTLGLGGSAPRTITVLDGPSTNDFTMAGPITSPIDPPVALIKDGHGTLLLSSPGTNTYAGSTWVKQGLVRLGRKLPGDLRVGDGVGPAGEAVVVTSVILTMNLQRSIVVDADGLYDVGLNLEQFEQLTINGGTVTPGQHSGELKVRTLVMNGGVIDLGVVGSLPGLFHIRNVLNARIEATSTATQTPIIRGAGRLVLDGTTDVIVNNGPQAIDLKIEADIASSVGTGLRKSGPGVAQFTFNNAYTGPTVIEGGTLLIDGAQPTSIVNLTGGTLGGTGRTGSIAGTAGTIAPGHSPGILRSGDVTLAAGVTFAPELNGTTAGTGYDQLNVTGTVALANATLAPAIASTVTLPPDAKLTIIDNDGTDTVTGTFANLARSHFLIAFL